MMEANGSTGSSFGGRFDLVCIGSGPAGEKAATQAAYFRRTVAIVEQHSSPGGAMVNTGTIPSKALRETALVCSALTRRPLPGTSMRINHNVSVAAFMARRHLIEMEEHDRIEASMDRHDINVFHGRGRLIGPNHVAVDHEDGSTSILEAANVLIATGSSPVRPSHIPFNDHSVVDADGILTLPAMPKSLVIVGAGVIGCEYASIFAEMGVAVTIVNPKPDIMPFLDRECRERLMQSMREREVEFRLGQSVKTVRTDGPAPVMIEFEDGGSLSAEVLLWAAGRQSNTKGLGLEALGVHMDERGTIKVNEHYQTAVESIYAAGDCIGFPALTSTSMEQGRVAACHMFGIDFKQRLADLMPMGIYTIPAISSVGLSEDQAQREKRDVVIGRAMYRFNVRGRMLGDEIGMLKCVYDRASHVILGACIVGEDATELIHQAQAAIIHGDTIEHFIGTCYNYPSLSELYKYAAYSALQAIAETEGRHDVLASRAMVA